MGVAGEVRVAWSGIRSRLSRRDVVDLFLVFAPSTAFVPGEALRAVEAARDHANSLVRPETIEGNVASLSPKGPVVHLGSLSREEAENRAWLEGFAAHLSAAGLSGSVKASPQVFVPRWAQERMGVPHVTGFLAYRLDQAIPPGVGPLRWLLDPPRTRVLADELAAWATIPGADILLRQSTSQVRVHDPAVGPVLASSIAHLDHCGVWHLRRRPWHIRTATLGPQGSVTVLEDQPQAGWESEVATVLDIAQRHREDLDLAFLRLIPGYPSSWFELQGQEPVPPHTEEGHMRLNRHLWSRWTPDAFGIQVLTDDHLERANTLTGWDVQEIAPGRHLVQARDLEPWFGRPQPPADVLSAARADFGAMILTPDVIKANPRPGTGVAPTWTGGVDERP